MTKTVAAEDVTEIEVSLGTVVEKTFIQSSDVFGKPAKDLKGLDGLSASFKRKSTREISKAHRGSGGAQSKKEETNEITGYNLFNAVLPPYNLDYLSQLYEKSAPHMAAVDAKVANIVGLGYDFEITDRVKLKLEKVEEEKKLKNARRRIAEAKITVLEWLQSCNEEDDFLETLTKVWTDLEATGNGYLEVGRKSDGSVGYLGHVPSATMRIRQKRDGYVQIISNRAVFFRNFGDKVTVDPVTGDSNPNEIIHFKTYSPTNGYYGVPKIMSAMQAVLGNELSSRYNLDYFENKAVPRYVIVIKGGSLSPTAEKRMHEFFQTGLKGKHHRTLYVPLPAESPDAKVDFKMEAVEAGVQDASFINMRKGNVDEILMAHRVPINKVSVAQGASLAVARDADKTFKEQVCRPSQRVVENKLNKIVKEKTDLFDLRLNQLTLTDEDTQSKIDERYLRMQVVVPNEIRARLGLPGRDGGDKPVELKPQAAAEQRTQGTGNRTRDQNRSGAAPDKDGEARNPQGEGRQQA
jgi:PBSX family phage portal protein